MSLTIDAAKVRIQEYVMQKSTILTAYCTASPIIYSIVFSEFSKYAALQVLRLHKFSLSTPALSTLYWPPVNTRVDFKTTSLVYKAINCHPSSYHRSPAAVRHTPEASLGWLVWKHMATLRSAMEPQWYRTESLTVWKLSRLLIFLKRNKDSFFIVSQLYNDMWLFQSWYTLTDPAPWEALGWTCLHIINHL